MRRSQGYTDESEKLTRDIAILQLLLILKKQQERK